MQENSPRYRTDCTAGRQHFLVRPDGIIARCKDNQSIIGHVLDPTFFLIDHSQRTPWPCNGCYVDCNYSDWTNPDGTKVHTKNLPRAWLAQNPNYVVVSWRNTGRCDLNCHYCAALKWRRFKTDELDVNQTILGVKNFVSTWSNGLLDIIGGEPIMHPGWSQAMRIALESNWSVVIHTNFSKPHEIIEAIKTVKPEMRHKLKLIISCHIPVKGFNMETTLIGIRDLREIPGEVQMTVKFLSYEAPPPQWVQAARQITSHIMIVDLNNPFNKS